MSAKAAFSTAATSNALQTRGRRIVAHRDGPATTIAFGGLTPAEVMARTQAFSPATPTAKTGMGLGG